MSEYFLSLQMAVEGELIASDAHWTEFVCLLWDLSNEENQ